MRAVVLRETGGPDRLAVEDVPAPEGAAVVGVRAAGVNFMDVLVRRGEYPQPPPLPAVLGAEVAGDLDGRRVLAFSRHSGGGYAEAVAVDPDWVFDLPDSASFEEGASFLMTFLTAWIPLREVEGTVLVTAAAGGVGSAAVQIASHLGAHVIAAASTEEKRRAALELGAAEAVGYDELPEAVDVVFDPVGGDLFAAALRSVRPLGRAIAVGYAGGPWQDVSPAWLVGRNLTLQGFYLGRLLARDPGLVRRAAGDVLELWRAGAVRPLVGASFPLERAPDAHRLIEERRHVGKVVLVP